MRRRVISIIISILIIMSVLPQFALAAPALRRGSKGSEVSVMQTKLIELGYLNDIADGSFGAKTLAAVKDFQRANGLVVDGIAGPKTQNALYGGKVKPANQSSGNTSTPPSSSGSSNDLITVTLRKGSKGSQVTILQRKLNELGFNCGAVDGSFGGATQRAVISYQSAMGLARDGVVGPATRAKLNASKGTTTPSPSPTPEESPSPTTPAPANPITVTLRKGSKGSQVTILQKKLNELGFNCGAVDGSFGGATQRAVIAYQSANGLAPDGIVGPATRAKLNASGNKAEPTPAPTPTPSPSPTPAPTPTPSPSPSPTPSPTPAPAPEQLTVTLRKGSKGSQVEILQRRLNELGFNCGAVDGSFGGATQRAVIQFQAAMGLAVDGVVGPATRAKLNESGTPKPNEPAPMPDREMPASDALKGKVIILDPGHGGNDYKPDHEGYYEKHLALDMALKLRTMLENAGATVHMTRSDDSKKSLFYRSSVANKVILDLEIVSVQGEKDKASEGLNAKELELKSFEDYITGLADYKEALIMLQEAKAQEELNLVNSATAVPTAEPSETTAPEATEAPATEAAATEAPTTDAPATEPPATEAPTTEAPATEAPAADPPATEAPTPEQSAVEKQLLLTEAARSNLSQRVKDQLHLGNTSLTSDHLPELDKILTSVDFVYGENQAKISTLSQEIEALSAKIKSYDAEIAELKRLIGTFQHYFDNPTSESRVGAYATPSINGKRVASPDLKKVMDLTGAKYHDNVIFLSIHLNATVERVQTYISGVDMFYRTNQPKNNTYTKYYTSYNDAARKKLAAVLLQETNKTTNFRQKRTYTRIDDFSVLRENNLVSALAEIGFMNNPNDLELVKQESVRLDAAYGMLKGIVEYFK